MALITSNFKGLNPALVRQQPQEPYIIDGKNFIIGAKGPKSFFGSHIYIYERLTRPFSIQSILVDDEYFIFTENGILFADVEANKYFPWFAFPSNTEYFPWSMAFVGNRYYFAKKGSSILQYNPLTGDMITLSDANIPTNPVAVTQSAGRLIILGEAAIAWSAIDNGTDLTPDAAGTGAGFQLTAIAGGGSPLAVKEISDGFITYLTQGILISRAIDSIIPFHHTSVSAQTRPINPFAIADISRQAHIVLSQTGFYSISGVQAEVWQPLMSEYFKETLFQKLTFNDPKNYRLFYDEVRQLLFVSYREGSNIFDKCFVLYVPRDEWGSFDYPHHGIMTFPKTIASSGDNELIYIDGNLFARNFTQSSMRELYQDAVNTFKRHSEYNAAHETYFDGVSHVFHSEIFMDTVDFSNTVFPNPGLYSLNTEITNIDELEVAEIANNIEANQPSDDDLFCDDGLGFDDDPNFEVAISMQDGFITYETVQYIRLYEELDSFIEIGPFRLRDPEAINRFYSPTLISIVSTDPASEQVDEDWLTAGTEDIEEDWNVIVDEEDWGEGLFEGNKFTASLRASNDAYTLINGLTDLVLLDKIQQDNRRILYSCYEQSLYMSIRILLAISDSNYEIVQLEFDTPPTGRQQ